MGAYFMGYTVIINDHGLTTNIFDYPIINIYMKQHKGIWWNCLKKRLFPVSFLVEKASKIIARIRFQRNRNKTDISKSLCDF